MKKFSILTIVLSLVFLSPLMGEDDEAKKKTVDVKLKVGAEVTGKDDFQGKVNEYKSFDDGVRPILKAKINGRSNNTYFNLFSNYRGDSKEMFHQFDLDVNRVFRQTFSFDSIYHRLDHDPLTNIDVVSEARSGAYVDDFNPNDQYHITRTEFLSTTEFFIPQLPFLKFFVEFRNEHRTGSYQARTLSKCSACHIVAKSRSINNNNTDIRIGGNIRIGKANVDYSFTHNKFEEKDPAPTNHYLKVIHPEKKVPVFNSRIGVGNDETLPFDGVPESKKDTHLFSAAVPVSDDSTFTAQYVNSKVKNVSSDLQWTSNSFAGAFSTRLGRKGFFNVSFQHIKIENDSIFIDVNEPLDIAGPKVGLTYAGAYGEGTFDWTRNSSLNRTVLDVNANVRYKLSKKVRLRLGYEYKNTKRDFTDVDETKSNTFKANIRFRPTKMLKITLDGKIKTITDPFANMKGGIAPTVQTTAYTNPFVGTQFFQWHRQRVATLTNFPEDVKEFKARFSLTPSATFALNGNFVYRTEDNDNLNYTGASWNRDMTQWGLDMFCAPNKKLPITASFYNYKNKYDSIFAIAVLEGCGAGIVGGMTGTLTDMMGYDIDTKTLLVNLHYLASKKLSLLCAFNYNESLSEMVDLALDTSQVPFIPGSAATALNFDDFGGVAEYSKLNMKQMIAQLGFNYALSKSLKFNGSFFYYFYDDLTEYLFTDTTGKSYSFFAGFTWSN